MSVLFDWMLAWFLVSLGAIAIAGITAHLFNKRSKKLSADLKELTAKHSEAVTEIIKSQLSPTIHLHDGLDAVTKRIADMIDEVAQFDRSDRIMEFFGAASLAAPEDDLVTTNGDGNGKRLSQRYEEAISAAKTGHVELKRYISLFTEEKQLKDRSLPVQERYVAWLKHQMQLLDDYSKYEVAHVVRAPNWGSNMARIITKKHVMEITGNGKAAIVITDKHIAERVRQYAYDSAAGKSPKNPIKFYGKSSACSLDDFQRDFVDVAERVLNLTRLEEQQKKEKLQNESEQQPSSERSPDN